MGNTPRQEGETGQVIQQACPRGVFGKDRQKGYVSRQMTSALHDYIEAETARQHHETWLAKFVARQHLMLPSIASSL